MDYGLGLLMDDDHKMKALVTVSRIRQQILREIGALEARLAGYKKLNATDTVVQ